MNELVLLAQFAPALAVDRRQWTRIGERRDVLDREIACTRNVDSGTLAHVGTAQEAVECDRAVALGVEPHGFSWRKVLEAVCEHVRMRIAEDEWAELHDADEAAQILDFGIGIAAVEHAREVEELCALINLRPEAFLERFFNVALGVCFLD